MESQDGGPRPDRHELSPKSRRWFYAIAGFWLLLAALATGQWLLADSSTGRWLAGVQVFIGVGLGVAYLVQAKRGRRW